MRTATAASRTSRQAERQLVVLTLTRVYAQVNRVVPIVGARTNVLTVDSQYQASSSAGSEWSGGSEMHQSIRVRRDPSPLAGPPEPPPADLFKTRIWIKDYTGRFSTSIELGTLATIPEFINAIREGFLKDNEEHTHEMEAKGAIEKVKIMFWNLMGLQESDADNTVLIESRNPNRTLVQFRDAIAWGFQQYREEAYGERVLCIATALFEEDRKALASTYEGEGNVQ